MPVSDNEYNDFRKNVEIALAGVTNHQIALFSWLCAIRVLPFLCYKNNFNYWQHPKRKNHIYSILKALDYSYFYVTFRGGIISTSDPDTACAIATDVANYITSAAAAANTAADAAHGAFAAAAAYASRAAADTAAYAARAAAADAAAYTIHATTAAYSARGTAAAYAAVNAVRAVDAAKIDIKRFINIILDDLQYIKNGNENRFFQDFFIYKSIEYGDIWENFNYAMRREGCDYWADLYTTIFLSGFYIDEKELHQRLSVPKEIESQGVEEVGLYLTNANIQGSVITRRETRLIILGTAGSGKTTLARRLNNDFTNPSPIDSTHGVDTSILLNFNGIKAHIWDFGGQVIYHSSHRCFMSANCVFILVVNARTEENRDITRINYWLDTIRIYSEGKAKVFIVINESDDRKQNTEDYGSLKDNDQAYLIHRIDSFNICKDMVSLGKFKNRLAEFVESVGGHQLFGKNDSQAMEVINTLFEQNKQVLESVEFERILNFNGIQNKKDQQRVKKLFNTLGIALSYEFIKDHYVIDPYWISHGVYKIVDYLQKNKTMFIKYDDLSNVFMDEPYTYPAGKRDYILDLMDHHKIGFHNINGIRGLIVPCAAPHLKPSNVIIGPMPDCLIIRIERDDLYEFPADFFYRYVCVNKDDIHETNEKWAVWQTGMVLTLKDENAIAIASAYVELIENRRIEITTWGVLNADYSAKLESRINDLLVEYNFKSEIEKKERFGKTIKFITLMLEAVAKGVTKAFIESVSGGIIKSFTE